MSYSLLFATLFPTFITTNSIFVKANSIGNRDNRYSFSLTTFSPNGQLQQVEYATLAAATLGDTPILATIINTPVQARILFCSRQTLPSPLIKDDGTPRFISICPGIAMTHSGLSADGRVLLAAAQRLAIEHEYTYDEDIPISIFLEELSLLFQKYTMKPGSRPFGCSLIIGDCTCSSGVPALYRMGPSGVVERFDVDPTGSLVGVAMILGVGKEEKSVRSFLADRNLWKGEIDEDKAINIMMDSILKHHEKDENKSPQSAEEKPKLAHSFITASMGAQENLKVNFRRKFD